MQPLDDFGGLQHLALSRRVRRDVARPGDEDVAALLRVPPVLVLLHGGFQHPISVKVGVFAHNGSHQCANQRPGGMPKREVPGHNAASLSDLRLSIQGEQELLEQFRSLRGEVVEVASLSGQRTRWDVEETVKIHAQRPVEKAAHQFSGRHPFVA